MDDSLVAPENRLKIRKCNQRLSPTLKSNEPTIQVALDALKLTPFYNAFEVLLACYVHEFNMRRSLDMSKDLPINTKINYSSMEPEHLRSHLKKRYSLLLEILDTLWKKNILLWKVFAWFMSSILWGMIIEENVDYVYLLWEDLVYQVENKNSKKNNDMYYPRFTKVIVDYFMAKDQAIPRRNKMFWHYARDDFMFTTIRVISKHQDTQVYGVILPQHLTNQAMLESEAYKTYLAYATGEKIPKPKYGKNKADSESSPKKKTATTAKGKRLKTSAKAAKPAKKKQPAKTSKAKGLTVLSEVALTEAEQMKLATKRSLIETHSSHASGSGADEGTGSKPGVPDVPTYGSDDEQISWKSSDEEDDDEVMSQPNSDKLSGDARANTLLHLPTPLIIPLQKTPRSQPPANVSALPLTRSFPNFGYFIRVVDRVRLKTLETNFSKLKQTNQFAAAVFSILGIVDAYLASKMQEVIKTAVQLQSDRLRDEAQAENEDFINKLDDNIKKYNKFFSLARQRDIVTERRPASTLSALQPIWFSLVADARSTIHLSFLDIPPQLPGISCLEPHIAHLQTRLPLFVNFGGVTDWYQSQGYREPAVMSSASSAVTYTSVYTSSEPGRIFWGADEELSDGGSPRVIVYGYDGLPMQPVAPPSPDYIPGPEEPHTPLVPLDEDKREPIFIQPHDPDYVLEPMYPEYIPLEDEHVFPAKEQPLPPVVSPTAESLGYVVESDLEEDPEEYEDDETEDGPINYPMDGGEDGDDDDGNSHRDDTDDDDGDEEDEEEVEEHLAPADSAVVLGLLSGFRPSISLPPEAEVERLLAMPTPPPSPPISLSPLSAGEHLARIASTQALIDVVTTALLSPPLPPSLYIPPPVDHRDDILEFEQPPRKRLCLYTLGSSTMDAEARRQGISEVGYGIRDTWVDPAKAVPEVASMTVGEVNTRVTELAELHERDTQDLYALLEDAQYDRTRISQRVAMDSQRVNLLMGDRMTLQETIWIMEEEAYASREAWAHSIGLS
ncbi:hypothetical protein Tco_1466682 [Tanacetum coccineum]